MEQTASIQQQSSKRTCRRNSFSTLAGRAPPRDPGPLGSALRGRRRLPELQAGSAGEADERCEHNDRWLKTPQESVEEVGSRFAGAWAKKRLGDVFSDTISSHTEVGHAMNAGNELLLRICAVFIGNDFGMGGMPEKR